MAHARLPFYAVSTAARRFADIAPQYRKEGFAIARKVLDAGFIEEMRDHVDFLQRKYPGIPTEHYHHLMMRNDPFWVRVVADPRLLDLAQSLAPFLKRGVALFSSHYFVKMPQTGLPVLWHQDGSYWPLKPMDVMTLWVAVDRSDRSNGCLRVVRRSQTWSLRDLKADKTVKNVLGSATHTNEDIKSDDIVDLELDPGDVSVHHPNIVHGSDPNTSNTRRCGLTIRYISPSTVCTDPTQPVMMLRGESTDGTNAYRSWPKFRPGYDMPFAGDERWNRFRHVVPQDEPFFDRTDYAAMDSEIKSGLLAFIDKLGGR